MDSKTSIYHRFLAAYTRQQDGKLVHCVGPSNKAVESGWALLSERLPLSRDSAAALSTPLVASAIDIAQDDGSIKASIFEKVQVHESNVIGVILQDTPEPEQATSSALDSIFATIILGGLRLDTETNQESVCSPDIASAIVDHFSSTLRYIPEGDQWDKGGRDYFFDRIRHFTDRGRKIELCLPAFPCKSSNVNKVSGVLPDRGEHIALVNLHEFVIGVEKIYKPGAKLWIISDGHVFSDCIGVDDEVVDTYGDHLMVMNNNVSKTLGGSDRVGFKSLVDLFNLRNPEIQRQNIESSTEIPQIDHHIQTKVSTEAELCRRILMLGFQSDKGELRQRIDAKDPQTLPLYRGFAKFMLEDLDLNPYTASLSRSQRRKMSSKVSFEMILRNQAYSNLVEILFPHHVRLSIHAHPNSGPKFGIQMLGPKVRPTDVLLSNGALMESDDLLHVPTPWHNSVVEIEGHTYIYVTKSKTARDALASGEFKTGRSSNNGEGEDGVVGDYFHLVPVSMNIVRTTEIVVTEVTPVVVADDKTVSIPAAAAAATVVVTSTPAKKEVEEQHSKVVVVVGEGITSSSSSSSSSIKKDQQQHHQQEGRIFGDGCTGLTKRLLRKVRNLMRWVVLSGKKASSSEMAARREEGVTRV